MSLFHEWFNIEFLLRPPGQVQSDSNALFNIFSTNPQKILVKRGGTHFFKSNFYKARKDNTKKINFHICASESGGQPQRDSTTFAGQLI